MVPTAVSAGLAAVFALLVVAWYVHGLIVKVRPAKGAGLSASQVRWWIVTPAALAVAATLGLALTVCRA